MCHRIFLLTQCPMREGSDNARRVCTYFSYLLTLLPFILLLIWLNHGTMNADQTCAAGLGCVSMQGFATDWGDYVADADTGMIWTNVWRMFNWHPLLMMLSFITLFSQGILHFRLLPLTHDQAKTVHVITQTLAVIFSSAGLGMIVKFKQHFGAPQFYNPHGWIGITAYSCFLLQWLHGLSYFLTCCPNEARRLYKPYHMYAGIWIYMATAMAVLSGLAGYSWIIAGAGPPFGVALFHWPNFIALSVFLCVGVVAYHIMPTGLPPGAGGGMSIQGTENQPFTQTPGTSYTPMKTDH